MRCHSGGVNQPSYPPPLTGELAGPFTVSYNSLRPFVRWYEWGDNSIRQTVTVPGHCGADESTLLQVLDDQNHEPHVRLAAEELQRLVIWLDANAPFYGTYRGEDQSRQRGGDAVPPPALQ